MGIIETGLEAGFPRQKILEQLQRRLNISLETTVEYYEKFRPAEG